MIAVVEDVPRLRDGLGIPVPPGVAASFTETATSPIADLVLRWARTHGPFTAVTIARRYGLGLAVVEQAVESLVGPGTLVSGSFVDSEPGKSDRQYCHAQVLALIKRRTLALLRKGVEPVEQVAYARFLAEWQGIGAPSRGTDAVLATLEQLAGYPMPASAVESMILPARVADYAPAMLDELTTSGEVFWVGDGPIGDNDGWVRWFTADMDPSPARGEVEGHQARELLGAFSAGGAYFFDALAARRVPVSGSRRPIRLRRRALAPGLGGPGHR